jgi:hypothetical protein
MSPKQHPVHLYRESIFMGESQRTVREIWGLLRSLEQQWPANEYHVVNRNCVDFAQAFIEALNVEEPFPRWVGGIAKGYLVHTSMARYPSEDAPGLNMNISRSARSEGWTFKSARSTRSVASVSVTTGTDADIPLPTLLEETRQDEAMKCACGEVLLPAQQEFAGCCPKCAKGQRVEDEADKGCQNLNDSVEKQGWYPFTPRSARPHLIEEPQADVPPSSREPKRGLQLFGWTDVTYAPKSMSCLKGNAASSPLPVIDQEQPFEQPHETPLPNFPRSPQPPRKGSSCEDGCPSCLVWLIPYLTAEPRYSASASKKRRVKMEL